MKVGATLPLCALLSVLLTAPLASAVVAIPQIHQDRVCVAPSSFPNVVYLGDCGQAPSEIDVGHGDRRLATFVCAGGLYVPGAANVPICYEIVVWYP